MGNKLSRNPWAMKEYAKELDIYEEIKTEYPQYSTLDVDKYIERAKALIEKK